jgi:hypothetical protein
MISYCRLFAIIFCGLNLFAVSPNDASSAAPARAADADTEKLGAFLGQWESAGKMVDTAYSHANQITATTNCNWSANGRFLICDQINRDAKNNVHNQLTIYAHKKEGDYTYTSFQDAGERPFTGMLKIEGNTWTYTGGEFEDKGKKIKFRTINVFTSSNTDTFRVEYSEDGGSWKTTGEGTFRKTSN